MEQLYHRLEDSTSGIDCWENSKPIEILRIMHLSNLKLGMSSINSDDVR